MAPHLLLAFTSDLGFSYVPHRNGFILYHQKQLGIGVFLLHNWIQLTYTPSTSIHFTSTHFSYLSFIRISSFFSRETHIKSSISTRHGTRSSSGRLTVSPRILPLVTLHHMTALSVKHGADTLYTSLCNFGFTVSLFLGVGLVQ